MYKTYYFFILILFSSASILQTSDEIADKQYKFIGTKACKKCHIKQFKSWTKTNMAILNMSINFNFKGSVSNQ